MARARPRLVVMLKEPQPGRVKTRLGRDIGMVAAAGWARRQSRALLRRLDDPRWDLLLAVAPDAALASCAWPGHLPRVAQGGGDLGARMARLLRASPPGPVCIVGGDIPGMHRAHVARAFAAMRGNDMVFGPASDGGFWLVGARRNRKPPRALFRGVRWSGPHALDDSLAGLGGLRVALVDRLDDVDGLEDLAAIRNDARAWA